MRPKSTKNHSGAQRLINVEQMTYQSNFKIELHKLINLQMSAGAQTSFLLAVCVSLSRPAPSPFIHCFIEWANMPFQYGAILLARRDAKAL